MLIFLWMGVASGLDVMNEPCDDQVVARYYIEPVGPDANRIVAEHLGQRGITCLCEEKMCSDGRSRNLWQITARDVCDFALSREALGFSCVFFRDDPDGPIEMVIVAIETMVPDVDFEKNNAELAALIKKLPMKRVLQPKPDLQRIPGVFPGNAMRRRPVRKIPLHRGVRRS